MRQIEWLNKARGQAAKIVDRKARENIIATVEQLSNWPSVSGVKALTGRKDYRIRVGRWRVFFEVEPERILIAEVKILNERTY